MTSRAKIAARIGAAIDRAEDVDGPELIERIARAARAAAGSLGVCVDGIRGVHLFGLPRPPWSYHELEPAALRLRCGDEAVARLTPPPGALSEYGHRDGTVLRLRAVADGYEVVIVLTEGFGSGGFVATEDVVRELFDDIVDAVVRFARRPRPAFVAAHTTWERSTVPMLLLDGDGDPVSANPAALRKLGVGGALAGLPPALRRRVQERIAEIRRQGGLPPGVSGDYSYVIAEAGREPVRIGLVPLEEPPDGEPGPSWLLSVEQGGPSAFERLHRAAVTFGLSEKEVEVLTLLLEGRDTRDTAQALGLHVQSVKYRLGAALKKTGTSNRAELLTLILSTPSLPSGTD